MSDIFIFLASFFLFVLAVALMAVGVVARRPAITGSCGGLGNIAGVTADCGGLCGRASCPRRPRAEK
jgi:hypothetical protein